MFSFRFRRPILLGRELSTNDAGPANGKIALEIVGFRLEFAEFKLENVVRKLEVTEFNLEIVEFNLENVVRKLEFNDFRHEITIPKGKTAAFRQKPWIRRLSRHLNPLPCPKISHASVPEPNTGTSAFTTIPSILLLLIIKYASSAS